MGGIIGEIDSPFNPARGVSATEDRVQKDERVLRVKYTVDDDEKAQRVGACGCMFFLGQAFCIVRRMMRGWSVHACMHINSNLCVCVCVCERERERERERE